MTSAVHSSSSVVGPGSGSERPNPGRSTSSHGTSYVAAARSRGVQLVLSRETPCRNITVGVAVRGRSTWTRPSGVSIASSTRPADAGGTPTSYGK